MKAVMPRALNGYAPVFTAIRLFLAALFFATAPHTLAAGKIWESDQSVMRKIGRVDVRMEKNFARNAAPGAFVT